MTSKELFDKLTSIRESPDFSSDAKQQEWVETLHKYGNAKYIEQSNERRKADESR